MSYLNSQYTAPSLNGIIEIYGDELTATNANIDNLTLNNLEIKNLIVDESLNVPYANITNIQTNTIFSNNAEITNIIGNTLNYNTIYGNIQSNNTNTTNLNVNLANIETANINTLLADSLISFDIESNFAELLNNNGTNLNYSNGNIYNLINENLNGNISIFNSSNINDLKGDYMTFNNGNIVNLTSNIAIIKNNYGENLNYNNANIGNLEVNGSLTLDTLTIDNFTTKKVFSERAVNYTQSSTNINVNKLKCRDAFIRKSNLMPTGTMIHNFNTTFCKYPDWILCDGRWLKVSQFEDLYLVIGDTFGYREINGYPEFKLFQGQGLFLRSFTGTGVNYYDNRVSRNKRPEDGPQIDKMRSHTHDTTMLYDESFNQYASGGSVGISGVNNIRNNTSGSLNQTRTSTTYTDSLGNSASSVDETYPMYLGAYLFIKT